MISVIVPVYRSERYLHRCVDSILNQTYRDLEVILVDDGSPDSSGAICDEYGRMDSRVRVIHKENGGVSTARNAGLDACTGDYIAFVDSDDYLDPEMYDAMMETLREYGCDVVMCDCRKEFPDRSILYSHDIRGGFYDGQQLRREHYPHLLMMENVEYPATISNCVMLWNRKLNTPDMRYEPGIRFSEDLLFGARLLRRAESFFYRKGDAFYHYVMNPTSATHTYAADKWENYRRLHGRIREEFGSDPDFDFRHQIDLCLLFFLYNTVGEINGSGLSRREKKGKILETLRDPAVKEMFGRVRIGALPIPAKQKLVTMVYKYRLGLGLYIAYAERK